MGKKKPAGKRLSIDELVLRNGGPATAEQRLEAQKRTRELMAKARRDLEDWTNSAEGQARETLRIRLEELRNDEAIKKSEVCLDVLDAFIHCVSYRWGAADSAQMIDLLAPHFESERAKKLVSAKLADEPKQKDKQQVRGCWDEWQKNPTRYKSKAEFARDMLQKFESLISPQVIERWCRDWSNST